MAFSASVNVPLVTFLPFMVATSPPPPVAVPASPNRSTPCKILLATKSPSNCASNSLVIAETDTEDKTLPLSGVMVCAVMDGVALLACSGFAVWIPETAAAIPLDRIVLETDCPYMSPEPFRGKRNDPGKLYRMAERLAEIRGISVEEVRAATMENGKRLYRI